MCIGEVAFGISQLSKTVVSTLVLWVELSSLSEDGLALCSILGEGSSIEEFFYRELRGISSVLSANFIIAATNHAIVHSEASTTKFGEHLISEFAESHREVLDLLFAFFGILIHREDAENHFLVLDVASSYEFLETIPVFSSVFSIYIGVELGLLELIAYVFFSAALTVFSKTSVELQSTIGRSISRHFDIVKSKTLLVCLDVAEHLDEVLDRGSVQFASAHLSLADQIFDLRILLARDFTLETIGSSSGVGRSESEIYEL